MYVHIYTHCTKVLQNSHDWGKGIYLLSISELKKCVVTRKKEYKILMFKMLLITEIIS